MRMNDNEYYPSTNKCFADTNTQTKYKSKDTQRDTRWHKSDNVNHSSAYWLLVNEFGIQRKTRVDRRQYTNARMHQMKLPEIAQLVVTPFTNRMSFTMKSTFNFGYSDGCFPFINLSFVGDFLAFFRARYWFVLDCVSLSLNRCLLNYIYIFCVCSYRIRW